MVSAKQLYELQQTDTEAAEKDAALKDVLENLANDRPIVVARQRASQLDVQSDAQNKARNSAQLAVRQVQEKVKNVEGKLYGGGITNTRELTAFEEERGYLQTQLAAEEDSLLELMVVVEDLLASRDEALNTLKSLETQRESQLPVLRQSQEVLEKELARLLETRKLLTPQIPPQQLAIYESLRKTRGGQAVAKLDRARGICQACRIALPVTDLQKAKGLKEFVQCNSCRRILYVE